MDRITRRLADASAEIRDGDLLLFRRRGIISIGGRGEWSHAAMAAIWDGTAMCLEVRERYGGRIVTLESQVVQRPSRIDVFKAFSSEEPTGHLVKRRRAAVSSMRDLAGLPYGWRNVLRVACYHLIGIRFFMRPDTNDLANGTYAPFCSQAVARAYRLSGVDAVPCLADRATEPSDLARSPFFHYLFTLAP
jgi:hypothetical protein